MKNPQITYNVPGTYTVTLTSSNGEKTGDITKSNFIRVLAQPEPDFTASNNAVITEKQSVTFTDLSTGEPDTWNWEFEGGTPSTSTEKNPTVSYSTGGVFNVKLTISNGLSSKSINKMQYMAVIPTTGLRGFYPLDGNFNDASGNNFHGTYTGEQFHHSFASNRHDEQNKSSKFSGAGGSIDLGTSVGNNVRTFSMWVSPEVEIKANAPSQRVLGRGCHCDKGFIWYFDDDGVLKFTLFNINESGVNVGFGLVSLHSQWLANEWYHIAVVIDPTNGSSLYVNGTLQHTSTKATLAIPELNEITAVNQWGTLNSNHFRGKIDQIRFYENALSSNQIQALSRE